MVTQENTPTTATTPSTPSTPDPTKDLKLNAEDKFKYGVIIRGKFIGVEDVKEDHGDEICRTSMIKLKALVLAKKEHKQRICVKITLDGVEILDEKTNTPMFNHAVTKISYIARDVDDSRAIGYIYKNSANSYQYFAIKTLGQAQELFNSLKELFEVVLEMRTRARKEQQASTAEKKEETPTAAAAGTEAKSVEESKDPEIIGLEDKIKQMNDQPAPTSLLDINSDPNNLVSSFEDSLTLNTPPSVTADSKPNNPSDDLFSLMDPATNAPSPQDNALAMLKTQISNIQTFSMPPPRAAPPTPGMMAANPFGASPMTPPVQMNNPFGGGNMGVAMGVPLTSFPQPGAPGFINPSPNVFSSQIPNPQAAVNPNPSTSQLPW